MKTLLVRAYGLYLNLLGYVAPRKAGVQGFLLFCRPFRLPMSGKQKAFLNTAERSTISHEGQSIQVYKWGNGSKKLLFLHGWQSHTYRWKPYIEALVSDDHTIYSLDAPGHGNSQGNFLSVPLYSNLVENFIREHGPFQGVVAHSLGGFTLLYTLYRYPLLPVSRIILMAPPGEASDFISVFQSTLKISNRTLELIVDHFASRYDVTPDFFSTVRFAENLTIKGLIIHDEDDAEAPYHYSVPLSKVWSRSRLVTTKGYGHNLRSTVVVKEVVDFINEPVSVSYSAQANR